HFLCPSFTRPYRRKATVLLAVALLASLLWTPRPVLAADDRDSSFLDLSSSSGRPHVFATGGVAGFSGHHTGLQPSRRGHVLCGRGGDPRADGGVPDPCP